MGPEWIVVGVIAVAVLFGAKKIPEMARSVGRAQGEFKRGLRDGVEEDQQAAAPAPQSPAAAPAPQPPAAQQQPPQPPQNGAQG
ncbi:MAG TPA: twin-arginine translocase TatA/TatE family subunit [Actinomycetota bacterium]